MTMGLKIGASIRPSASGVQRSAPMACPRCSRTSIRRRRVPTCEGAGNPPRPSARSRPLDLYGDGEQEIIADHEPSGTSVWRYTPPAGSKSINGGTWSLVSTTPYVLPTSPSPSQYLTLHAVDAGGGSAVMTDQGSYWTFGGNGFHSTGKTTLAPSSSDPSYYLDNMSGLMPESHSSSTAPNLVPANVYRTPNGVGVQTFDGTNWVRSSGRLRPRGVSVCRRRALVLRFRTLAPKL